jgi:hypothetical protein
MTIATEPAGKPVTEERDRFPGRPTMTIATEPAYLGDEERTEFPSRACRLHGPRVRRLSCHQRRAGLGVWACTRSREDRAAVKLWKRRAPLERAGNRAGKARVKNTGRNTDRRSLRTGKEQADESADPRCEHRAEH